MHTPSFSYEMYEVNRKDAIRLAEMEHLARLARTGQPRGSFYRPVLAWTGRRLLASGLYLLRLANDTHPAQVRIENA
jgi:hypothetical protein